MRVSQDVLEVLDRGRCDGRMFFLPGGTLDRKLYERVDKALRAAGGKWQRFAKAHVFACDAADALDPILLTGEVTDAKKELQAFYTPDALAADVVAEACVGEGMRVLEPNAGEGALARHAVEAGGQVWAVEINSTLRSHLEFVVGEEVHLGDFLTMTPRDFATNGEEWQFDRVVMNPPFAKQADAKHVLHAYGMLKPGGRLVAIMSAAVTFRETALYREVRELVEMTGGRIERLPEGSFRESGTSVNTVLVVIDKPNHARQDAEAAAGMRSAA